MTRPQKDRRPKDGDAVRREPRNRELLRVCGLSAVSALFERDPQRVERLFFEQRLRGAVGGFCTVLARAHKPYREVDAVELGRVAGTALHGGIAAVTRPRSLARFDQSSVRDWARTGMPILILDGIGNPHNLGAIARTAAFFGIEHILLADRPDQALPSDASYRIAAGGLEHVSLCRAPLPAALRDLRQSYRVIGTLPGKGELRVTGKRQKPPALVLGNEETGIDSATLAACDETVTIPGSGRMQSLNVAAAAAILIYALAGDTIRLAARTPMGTAVAARRENTRNSKKTPRITPAGPGSGSAKPARFATKPAKAAANA
jgi:RNA methyltransferase, TrmH family